MTKMDIIDAAFRVWGRDYYRKTSLSQLAKELGVSKPALYRHFESKQALITAMFERFFDAFTDSVRSDFDKALQINDSDEGVLIIIKSISSYFALNGFHLIFSLVNIYDCKIDGRTMSERINERGVDLTIIRRVVEKKYIALTEVIQLIFASLTFSLAYFHNANKSFDEPPSDQQVQKIIFALYDSVKFGLKFYPKDIDALDFDKLETMVDGTMYSEEINPLFKAVAEAVAEAGPWKASMEMVAKRMGLSKSSLYGYFKNRKDMLRRLFLSEFNRITDFARQGVKLSSDAAEQFYLGIYSIAVYLRSHHEILIAIGWIRTRKLDLGKPNKKAEFFRIFDDIKIESLCDITDEEKHNISHWVLFLLINTLTRPYISGELNYNDRSSFLSDKLKNNDIRILYKFITLGLGGFLK